MPATIVVVHPDPETLGEISAALRTAGYDVAEFIDPLAAIAALERARVLITLAQFGQGRLHGIALAQMAQARRPGIKIVFTALPEYEWEVKGLGEFLPLSVSVPELLETVERLVQPGGGTPTPQDHLAR
jgi:DNA-binding NtrC family response regulator